MARARTIVFITQDANPERGRPGGEGTEKAIESLRAAQKSLFNRGASISE